MKKLRDMESEFFENFSSEEVAFMESWEQLYFSPEFQEDTIRVKLEVLSETSTQERLIKKFQSNNNPSGKSTTYKFNFSFISYIAKVTNEVDSDSAYLEKLSNKKTKHNKNDKFMPESIYNFKIDDHELSYCI